MSETPTTALEGGSVTTSTFDPIVLDAERAFAGAEVYEGVKIVGFGEESDALILGWHDLDVARRVYGAWDKFYAGGTLDAEEIEGLDILRRKVWISEHVPDQCEVWEWSGLDADERADRLADGEEAPTSCICHEWSWWAEEHPPESTGTDLIEVMTVRIP